ncbi:MAG TPA: hypothetical protein VNL36_06025 [Bacteroidota bacterium]|nr:hypothetical protein [Bacteroidota bacterium]
MQPSTTLQLRKQLESFKQFREKNVPNRLSYGGYLAEFIVGLYLLARVALADGAVPSWAQVTLLGLGIALMLHAFYLLIRYHYDRRMIWLLEMVLSDTETSNET